MLCQQQAPSAHRVELRSMVLHHLQHCSSTAGLLQALADGPTHIIHGPGPAMLPLGSTPSRLLVLLLCLSTAAAAAVTVCQLLTQHMVG